MKNNETRQSETFLSLQQAYENYSNEFLTSIRYLSI